ncbi:MAG: SPOR domain-containing protein [Prevotellaceae bacterium]|nr:SPOR domain-containing protein [Prevotellaceae bacterium]
MKNLFIILCAVFALYSCSTTIPRAVGAYAPAKSAPQKQKPELYSQTQKAGSGAVEAEALHAKTETPAPAAISETKLYNTASNQPTTVVNATPTGVKEETFVLLDANDIVKLKTYSVIVGSFTIKDNAVRLKEGLKKEGYDSFILINNEKTYRVAVASYDTYETAKEVQTRELATKYADAWVLVQKR